MDNEPASSPASTSSLASRHGRPSCYQPTAREEALWAEEEAEFADSENWGGADEHEMTEDEWAEAAAFQAAEAVEDPVFAAFMQRLTQSPAFRPWSPPRPDDDDDA